MYPIHITDLSFTYRGGERKALDGINFDLRAGEMAVLLGRSGAGKSTLCRCLNGIIPAFQKGEFSGDVRVFGDSTKDKHIYELAQYVGMVFQDFEPQLFSTTVELEVAFCPENIGLPREEIAARVEYALKAVGLAGFENRQPYNLSGGEKQRLAIASVLSGKPKVLVLDEPTTDLDPQGRHDIFSALKTLKHESTSLMVVEQDTEDAIDADRILIMDAGGIVASGEAREVLTNVQFLERHGIRPPQIVKLFREMAGELAPFTAKEAYESGGNQLNAAFDEKAFGLLQQEDERRRDRYGRLAIEARKLKYSYPDADEVLTGIELQIREGEFVAIIGQNGSGKTTLAKHFNGLLRPSGGSIRCLGRDAVEMNVSELGKTVGYVFQNPDHQIFATSVRDEITFGPKNYGLSQDEITVNVAHALEAVHLDGYEEDDPFSLTKGERQRVAVASVLACRPKVLILDEPTTGLDYPQQRSMMELLRGLNDAGHTIVVITHALWVVAEYAHRAIVMHNGHTVMDGSVREVFSQQDQLDSFGMKLPEIVKLGNMLGRTLLSVEEHRRVLKS